MDQIRTTRAEIDLRALQNNLSGIRKRVGPGVSVMGIVKANAYGHGAIEIARALVGMGIEYLGVSLLEEGVALRRQGITCPILVLGGIFIHQVRGYFQHDLDITVPSLELARQVDAAAASAGVPKPKVHLNFDTGMGRLGTRIEQAPQFIEEALQLKHIYIAGVYSHFATSDEADKSYAREQINKFECVLDIIRGKGAEIPYIHMSNSGAVLDLPEAHYTMVRPGIMLYGVYPSLETSHSVELQPVMTLRSKINFVKDVPAGTSIGYGRRYTTSAPTKIVTIPIGYGDGYSRRFTNTAHVLIHGKRFRVTGTVSMDQILVDVGQEFDGQIGDDVVLIGTQGNESVSAWELALQLGTIPYEIFTGIAERVPRVLINE